MVFSIVLKDLKQERIWELPHCPHGNCEKRSGGGPIRK
jgi:hypothetical protein